MDAPVPGDRLLRADGIVWKVVCVDSESVLYEVLGMGEHHSVSLEHWRRLKRYGHLVAA